MKYGPLRKVAVDTSLWALPAQECVHADFAFELPFPSNAPIISKTHQFTHSIS
jgi:hypothetical protein